MVFGSEFIVGKEGVQILASWRLMARGLGKGSVSTLRRYFIIAWQEQKSVKKCKLQLRNVQNNVETTMLNQAKERVKAKEKVWEKGKEREKEVRVKEGEEREREKIVKESFLNVRK